MLDIMKAYSMTYKEYQDTPSWVIDLINERNKIDYRINKLKNGSK